MNILVRAPNWIGDQIMAYPFFHFLRKAYPDAHITAACVSWVEDVQFRDAINDVYVLPRPMSATPSWGDRLKVIEEAADELRARRKWDLALSLPNSFSAAWLMFRSGARLRRGYSYDGRGLLLNQRLKWNPTSDRHRAQAYLDLLAAEFKERHWPKVSAPDFFGIPPENELDPPTPGEMQEFNAKSSWPGISPIEPPEGPYWVLAPGATADSRKWSEESFAELSAKIAAQTGWPGLVVGGPKEAPLASRLCDDRSLKLKDYVARGPVSSLWKIFKQAKFTVTNESGLSHVAALCGSPVQIVCGAADPKRTRPIGPGKARVMVNPVDCWPCERNTCAQSGGNYLQCLRGISPDAVWEEIQRGARLA